VRVRLGTGKRLGTAEEGNLFYQRADLPSPDKRKGKSVRETSSGVELVNLEERISSRREAKRVNTKEGSTVRPQEVNQRQKKET